MFQTSSSQPVLKMNQAETSAFSASALLRNYATPLSLALMLIVGGSGLAIFFHFGGGGLKGVHEWLGLGLVAAVVLHLVRNGRAFKNLLAAPRSQVLVGASVLAVALFLSLSPASTGGNPARALMMAAERAPLSNLAPVLGVSSDLLVARLAEEGIEATPDQTIGEIASAARIEAPHLMGMLTDTATPPSGVVKP